MKSGSASEMSRRSVPSHLRHQKFSVPGAGTYNARDSVQVLRRDRLSVQDCTWQTTRRGFIDLPKNNPGPGTYNVENLQQVADSNRCKAMEAGFAVPLGPKDAMLTAVNKNQNPGPGSHHIRPLDSRKPGAHSTLGLAGPAKPLPDNGVPGPGTYEVDNNLPVPSFKICQDTQFNDKQESYIKQKGESIGPNHYHPMKPQEGMPGTTIGLADRKEEITTSKFTPAPNRYNITGDFDFRDPLNLNDKTGKLAKFAFGIKPNVKNCNQDVPGPGTYEVDQYPMNQKNIAYWIGTDVRRDLGVPGAKDFPGPGHYEHGQQMHPGAYIS